MYQHQYLEIFGGKVAGGSDENIDFIFKVGVGLDIGQITFLRLGFWYNLSPNKSSVNDLVKRCETWRHV